MQLLGLNPIWDQRNREKKGKQCTCPSRIIVFDMINHLMDVILHVLLVLINQVSSAPVVSCMEVVH